MIDDAMSNTPCNDLRSSLLQATLDQWSCVELPDGGVVTVLPLTYSDGDNVEVLVTASEGGIVRLTDWGNGTERLRLAGVNLEADRVTSEIGSIARGFGLQVTDDGELQLECAAADAGDALLTIAAAMLQLEGLAALSQRVRPKTFASRLSGWLTQAFPNQVSTSPKVTGRNGKRHTVTAAVHPTGGREVYLQAVAPAETRDRSLDHAFRIVYDLSKDFEAEQRVVVLASAPEKYDAADIAGLLELSYVSTWNQLQPLRAFLQHPTRKETRELFEPPAQGQFEDSTV